MRQRPYCEPLQWVGLLFLFLLAASSQTRARAQALPTASRSMDFAAFGGYTHSSSDFGAFNNNGGTVGVDITRYVRWRVAPSLEVRANYTSGPTIIEKSILAGIRLDTNIRRFHPYVDGLFGGSKIIFAHAPQPGYTYDIGTVYALGGGVDIDLLRNFQAKVDFQNEFMNFGHNGLKPANEDFTLTPPLLTIGVAYRIPFHRSKE
jgi:hypothetical protein